MKDGRMVHRGSPKAAVEDKQTIQFPKPGQVMSSSQAPGDRKKYKELITIAEDNCKLVLGFTESVGGCTCNKTLI
ncbi:Protein of unknown function [Pyronema omphalodes CBS 100304]|uniref:Uncharacterized protein n=1 Tax=Pyronema omphalodes (strain CBS 100304) TaxID=1076935 RepID=U4L5T7_PYROM|nr:Protein of unknown function [Pyronema omphalodes CBS 100304]